MKSPELNEAVKMRKPSHTKYTLKTPSIQIDPSKLSVSKELVDMYKSNAAEFSEIYTEDYVKQTVSVLISNRLKYLYENEQNFPSMGVPNNWEIESVRADFAKVFHRGFITVACVILNKQDNEKWLILFSIAVHHDTGTRNGIYVKIETKFFDINKFPMDQIPNQKLAHETATEMAKKQFEDTVKTQRVSRTMSKL